MNILLLDDDEQDTQRVKRHLSESDLSAHLTTSTSGTHALEALDEDEPDVVLVKHQRDSGRAKAFVNECRARGYDIPIIILSTDLDEEVTREALRLNVADVRDLHQLSPTAFKQSIDHALGRVNGHEQVSTNSRTDPKTGLLNRETILHRLRGVLKQSARNNFVSSVALMDVDNLDHINEEGGYEHGDRVLAGIARIVQDSIRESDFAGRYSGDQNLLICPHTKLHGTYALGNRITDRITDEISAPENGPEVTVSMGCISFDGAKQETVDERDLDDLMERAQSTVEGARDQDQSTVVGTLHHRMEHQ